MSQRRYLLDPVKVKEKRKAKKLSQRDLVDRVEELAASEPESDFGLSLRYLKKLEKTENAEVLPVTESTLVALARALECGREAIVSCTLVDPFYTPSLNNRGRERLLQTAIRRDLSGKPGEARTRCEELLNDVQDEASRTILLVRLLTFLEHSGSRANVAPYREAIDLGEAHLKLLDKSNDPATAERGWLEYQVGICRRQLAASVSKADEKGGQLQKAEAIFKRLLGSAEHKTSARHQLGVVVLEQFRLNRSEQSLLAAAKSHFMSAHAEWERLGDHRVGFADRRLAEVSEAEGEYPAAFEHLHAALVTFARERMQRDVDATRERLNALVERCLAPSRSRRSHSGKGRAAEPP
jgi:transcriptional regulator with XRE-family HTH domain